MWTTIICVCVHVCVLWNIVKHIKSYPNTSFLSFVHLHHLPSRFIMCKNIIKQCAEGDCSSRKKSKHTHTSAVCSSAALLSTTHDTNFRTNIMTTLAFCGPQVLSRTSASSRVTDEISQEKSESCASTSTSWRRKRMLTSCTSKVIETVFEA
jgi:hypothetical protein